MPARPPGPRARTAAHGTQRATLHSEGGVCDTLASCRASSTARASAIFTALGCDVRWRLRLYLWMYRTRLHVVCGLRWVVKPREAVLYPDTVAGANPKDEGRTLL